MASAEQRDGRLYQVIWLLRGLFIVAAYLGHADPASTLLHMCMSC